MDIDSRLTDIDDCLYRLAVRALIVHEGKVLLVHEKDDAWWSFPGGGIDYNEDADTALLRELKEELGITESDITSDFQIIHVALGAVVNGVPRANLFYAITVVPEAIRVTNDIVKFDWFTPEEILSVCTPFSSKDTAQQCIDAITAQLAKQK